MTAQPPPPSQTPASLNETPLSRHVATLLAKAGTPPEPGSLPLVGLLLWATEHHYANPEKAEQDLELILPLADRDPAAAYNLLADDRLLADRTLREAAATLASALSERLDDRSLPDPETLPA